MVDPHATTDDETPPEVQGLRIEGQVTDFGGLPLVGVRIEAAAGGGGDLDLLPTMSDGEGRFVLQGLEAGRYDLRFRLGKVSARTLGVGAGTTDLAVRLARPQGILLVAKTPPGDEPPGVLHVVLERRTTAEKYVREHVGRHLATRLLLWSIRPGTYRVTAWGGAYLPVRAEGVEVRDGRPAPELQVLLGARGARIEGRVVDAEGVPQPDVFVAWRRLEGVQPWPRQACSTRTDGEGRFLVLGLPSGRYRISVGTKTGPIRDHEVDVADEARVELPITLA